MKYIFVIALMVVLLVASASALPNEVVANIEMSATGGTITQVASNAAAVGGDDAVLSESITMTAVGTGAVNQDAQNVGAVDIGSDDATVDQSVTLSAQGSSVNQNAGVGNANILVGDGDDASVDQDVTMTATATNGPVNQIALNNAAWVGNRASINQTATVAGRATNDAVNQVGINTATVVGNNARIYQNTTATALATGNVIQVFTNTALGTGAGARYTQVIMGAGNSTGATVTQVGTNFANMGFFQNNVRSNQSVLFSAVADDTITQVGTNAVDAGNNAVIGQEAGMSADGVDVTQVATNNGVAGNNFAANQAIAFDTISDDGIVTQVATNGFFDLGNAGSSNSRLGQLISGASRGGDTTTQVFTNFAFLDHPAAGSLTYTVTQANIANGTSGNLLTQVSTNHVDWEITADGGLGQLINNRAQAPIVVQNQINEIIPA